MGQLITPRVPVPTPSNWHETFVAGEHSTAKFHEIQKCNGLSSHANNKRTIKLKTHKQTTNASKQSNNQNKQANKTQARSKEKEASSKKQTTRKQEARNKSQETRNKKKLRRSS